ncbi:MAG: 4Fe-4S dicluster domain-containing protein [Deltaproteobacteria bacterium]
MDMKRRNFLKLAGLSAIAGVGAPAAFKGLLNLEPSQAMASSAPEGAEQSEMKTGQRLGMVIDIRKFTEMPSLAQKCIDVCHTTHNVPDYGNPKDSIKWLWLDNYEHAFPEHSQYKRNDALEEMKILLACNHCDNPPCVRACPTQATFKMANGVVAMDYHRCIGCRFCMAACPYGARSFNWRDPRGKDQNGRPFINRATMNPDFPTRMRGVVEKCNFCVERISFGLLPACVEATGDTGAMIFGDLNDKNSEISRVLRTTFTIQRKPSYGTHPSLFYII